MKRPTTKNILFTFLLFLTISVTENTISAQGVQLKQTSDYPYLYLSSAYISTNSISHGTADPYYSGSTASYSDKSARGDFGIQINKNAAFEVGYMRTPLWITRELSLTEDPLFNINGGSSYSRISFYSFKFKHTLPLWKNRINFKTGLGYALGVSNVSPNVLGPSGPKTSTFLDISYTETKTLTPLHIGSTHFMTFDLGCAVGDVEWAPYSSTVFAAVTSAGTLYVYDLK